MKSDTVELLVARKSFTATVRGARRTVRKDRTLVESTDPVVKGREHLFALASDRVQTAGATAPAAAPRRGRT